MTPSDMPCHTPDAAPRVSCIVPAHNEEKTIARTLECLAAQQYPRERLQIVAALNGCTDGTEAAARRHDVTVIADERRGMSFGKNLGARAATGDILIFIDADTIVPSGAVRAVVDAMGAYPEAVATMEGRPDRGGLFVRFCFWLANRYARRGQVHAPGGVIALTRAVFDRIGGFDENLPQGTSTDLIRRAMAAGAAYVCVGAVQAVTSVRRFEKTGIIRQMLSWRGNHRQLAGNCREAVAAKPYEDIR